MSFSESEPSLEQHELATPEHCHALMTKGGSADKLPPDMLAVDTGQPKLPAAELRNPSSQEEVDALYRQTIRDGIVDHHGIDASVTMPAGVDRRCAAKMVADFPDEVVALIKRRDIRSVSGHMDSDLDSITATYFSKILVDKRSVDAMPSFSQRLADVVNLLDYGRFLEPNADRFVKTLPGYFGALKTQTLGKMGAEIGAVWRSADIPGNEKPARAQEVSNKWHGELMKHMFAVYNACAGAEAAGRAVNFNDLDAAKLSLPSETAALLKKGQEQTHDEFEKFNGEFEKAVRGTTTVVAKDGRALVVPTILFAETRLNPLLITNLTYSRMPPETIVMVYAGQDRQQGGDCYDVGIKVETASDLFDIAFLEAPLNAAEAELRAPILADLLEKQAAGSISEEDGKRLALWTTLRKGKEYLGHGDPTVAVAGNSLIAASNTSLLTRDGFVAVMDSVMAEKS